MSSQEPPPKWAADEITRYLDTARNNSFATFDNLRSEYQKLSEIDGVYRKLNENLQKTKDWFAALFLLRAHSSYLTAVSLGMSGQVPESYAILRLSLENALYGFYLSKNDALKETWLRRHDSQASKKKVRDDFKFGLLLGTIKTEDNAQANVVNTLYERTIDYGAHPNERALMQTLHITEDDDSIEFKSNYLTDDDPSLRLCLKTTAQIGVCVLDIFRLIYKERFDLLGLTEILKRLKQGL